MPLSRASFARPEGVTSGPPDFLIGKMFIAKELKMLAVEC